MPSAAERRFDMLYDRYFREVLAYCLRRGPVTDGYDAANEVFAIAWRRIREVPDGESARPWLLVVARRVLYRRRRSDHRFRRLIAKAASVPFTGPPNPETLVVQRVEYDRVVEAAGRLSKSDREVLNLAAWEGLPHTEIAEVLGCSVAAVDQRLHRAKVRLAGHYHAVRRGEQVRKAVGGGGS